MQGGWWAMVNNCHQSGSDGEGGDVLRRRPAAPYASLLRPTARAGRSSLFQIAFLHHAIVRLAHTLDAILRFAAVVRQRPDDLELALRGGAQRQIADEAHALSGLESIGHVWAPLGMGIRSARTRRPRPARGAPVR